MNRRMLAIILLLCLCWTAPMLAQTPAGAATYRVTIVLYPGDDAAAVAKRLAAMYRGTLETPVDSNGSFTIGLSEAGAGLMRRDPVVATAVPATATLPSSQRPVEISATSSWTLGPYQYDGSGTIRRLGSDFYVYDKLGRIVVSADAQPSVVHKQTYTYDPYGNLRSINTAGRAPATLDITGTSNRLASVSNGSTSAPVSYDGAGNFVSYLGATYEYDALNVMRRSITGGVTRSYVYTANDERIGTIEQTGSALRSDWTIRDNAGQVLRRYSKENNGEWKWQEDYIYRGTQMLAAEIPESPKTRHFHLDHLGTPRLITGNGGAEISRHTYHPFGEEIAPSASAREKKQFTGHERDSESLDYMHARFYAPFMGRFLSVDPVWDYEAAQRSPQLWNRYSYVGNNPLSYVDPAGQIRIRAHNTGHAGSSRPYLYAITFENRTGLAGRAIGGAAKRVLGPLKQLPGILDKGEDLLVGKDVGTNPKNLRGVDAIAGAWDTAKFEGAIQDKFKDLGATSVAGSGYYDAGDLKTLQKAVDAVLTDMVANGSITQQEADKVRKEYKIQRLRDDAEAASRDMNSTDDSRNQR